MGSTACKARGGLYARKHAPWANFKNLDHANERPYSDLAKDIANQLLPGLAFVIPNNCHNTHDCSVSAGDAWLAAELPAMISAVGNRGLVVRTTGRRTTSFSPCSRGRRCARSPSRSGTSRITRCCEPCATAWGWLHSAQPRAKARLRTSGCTGYRPRIPRSPDVLGPKLARARPGLGGNGAAVGVLAAPLGLSCAAAVQPVPRTDDNSARRLHFGPGDPIVSSRLAGSIRRHRSTLEKRVARELSAALGDDGADDASD